MSDEHLTDEQIEQLLACGTRLDYWLHVEGAPDITVGVLVRELKAARQEIARWEALPPRMTEAVIRPVYPIDESDYD